ncbi:MAG TPA: hypothetical protein VKU01_15740 [Bryobacteraceae bacterium]|nr:hypothetical protein [Bryobacteraceae bacterium]
MDQLANKTAYGSAKWRSERSGARMLMAGLGLLVLAFLLWSARDFISTLATKRVVAFTRFSTLHEGTELQLQSAFAAAKMSSPVEASFEPDRNPALHGRVIYYLSVTADTPAKARAELVPLTDALKANFPSAENNLVVTPDTSTVPAPNRLSQGIFMGVQAGVLLMILAGQLLIVIGGYQADMGRAALFAALAMPFIILIRSVFFPDDSDDVLADFQYAVSQGEWKFVLLLLALTPVSVILALWLTRKSRPTVGERRRA